MFDIASSELLVVAIVALLVVGPKDLPKLMRTVGQWVRRARMMTGQIRAGFDQMMQEAEFQEERERIMKMHPNPSPEAAPAPTEASPAPPYSDAVQTFSAAGTSLPEDASAPAAAADGGEGPESALPEAAMPEASVPEASVPDSHRADAPEHRA